MRRIVTILAIVMIAVIALITAPTVRAGPEVVVDFEVEGAPIIIGANINASAATAAVIRTPTPSV